MSLTKLLDFMNEVDVLKCVGIISSRWNYALVNVGRWCKIIGGVFGNVNWITGSIFSSDFLRLGTECLRVARQRRAWNDTKFYGDLLVQIG